MIFDVCTTTVYYYISGNLLLALELTNKLLEIEPTHQRALGNKQYYQKALDSSINSYLRKGDDETIEYVDETKSIKDEVRYLF